MESPQQILLVDDDETLRSTLGMRLKAEGFDVLTAESAERALAMLAVEKPNLVITDLRMGGMDGLALFAALQRTHPRLPVIILTGHGTIPEAVASTRQGVFSFLTKPVEAATLLGEIHKAFAQSTHRYQDAGDAPNWRSQIVTRSARMSAVLDEVEVVAPTDASVLIMGETGSGKELLAQAIHDASPRRDAPFVAVNCGAIPEALLESELFGYVKGAFTGAARDHKGLLLSAQGGTILFDEIGDMPLALQVKLLRVLQEREVRPLGGLRPIAIDVRVISATHRQLDEEISAGRFREDLYYRLNVVSFQVPALAERREDIPLLAEHFLGALAEKYRRPIKGFSPEAMEALLLAAWPGNVRQLFNVVEKCVALCTAPLVPLALAERAINKPAEDIASFDEARRAFERDYLAQLLKMTGGNVSRAARLAKRNRSDFYSLLNRHELDPELFKA